MGDSSVIEWLLDGDPAIRWQVHRDLFGASPVEWEAVRAKIAEDGWIPDLLSRQTPDGMWGGGIYSPKWTSTTYTLLTLMDLGLSGDDPAGQRGAILIFDRVPAPGAAEWGHFCRKATDLCVLGFWLGIGAHFLARDERVTALASDVLAQQMGDGGWNCRIRTERNVRHSSFHTTFNVLEGLWRAFLAGALDEPRFRSSESRAMAFMLEHRMFRSDRTGEVVHEKFTQFSYPPRWHYDVLRGLDYLRHTPEIHDRRLADAFELLESRRRANGRWPVQNKHPGEVFFDMERTGGDSRWNTLRALRVLAKRRCRA